MDKVEISSLKEKVAPKPMNLPKNALERAEALIGLMGRMASHIDRETQAVKARRPVAELKALVKEKEPMSLVFEEISRLLRIDTDGVAALPEAVKAGLREGTARLRAASIANAMALRHAEAGQSRVVETLVGASNRLRARQNSAYAAQSGGGRPAPRGYGPPPGYVRAQPSTLNATL